MSIYRPITKVAVVLSILFLVFLAIDPFTGFGQTNPQPNIIGNRIYCDHNLDGQLSSGEFIAGVTINVAHASSTFTATTVTDAGGNYLFTGLPVDPSVSNFVTDTYTVMIDIDTLPPTCNVPAVDPDGVLDNMSIVVFDANRTDNRDQDFGYKAPPGIVPGTSGIGNRIFCDADLSGDSRNPNHSERIPDVGVMITNVGGFTATTVTDDSGNYFFNNIGTGTYTVTVDPATLPLACNIPFVDGDGVISPTGPMSSANESVVTLSPDQLDYSQDFGYEPTEALAVAGDKIWCDDDGDLTQDGGEGIGGVSISITENVTATTPAFYTTVTNDAGSYRFINLASGSYTVVVDRATLPSTCNTPFDSGDPDNFADNQTTFTLSSGQLNSNIDIGYAGFLPVADIGGQVWCETTLNDMYDVGETPFIGVQITLTNSSGISTTIPTDVSGRYLFSNLTPDTYTVAVDSSVLPSTCNEPSVDPDGIFDNQTTIELAPAVDQLDQNFAYVAPANTPTPLPDTPTPEADTPTPEADTPTPEADTPTPEADTPTPEADTPTPEADTPTPEADTPTPEADTPTPEADTPTPEADTPTPEADTPTPEATEEADTPTPMPTATATSMPTATNTPIPPIPNPEQLGSIGDSVWCDNDSNNMMDDGEGIQNVTVTLIDSDSENSPSTVTTSEQGNYLFEDLSAGTYTIVISNTPSTCDAPISEPDNMLDGTATVNLVAGESNLNIDFVLRSAPVTISDVIWVDIDGDGVNDDDEPGFGGVIIRLYDIDGALLQEVTTDPTGAYTIPNIMPTQQYYVILTLPDGWAIASQEPSGFNTTVDPVTGQSQTFSVEPGVSEVSFGISVASIPDDSLNRTYLPAILR